MWKLAWAVLISVALASSPDEDYLSSDEDYRSPDEDYFSSDEDYLSEPVLKLLGVDFYSNRFPAMESNYRVNVTHGRDEEVSRGPLEEANNYPEKKLMMSPGGCAFFHLPTVADDKFLMAKPAKKMGEHGENYRDKADITLSAFLLDQTLDVHCSKPSRDSSSEASDYCILDVKDLVSNTETPLTVSVCVPSEETREAAIWELILSPLDDSRRVKGTFEEDARLRIRRTQETPEFNTHLTMVSIVGKAGVGKSTVASLLSGNSSMFTTDSSSSGTTTIGADMSTIIPSYEYKQVLEEKLEQGPLFQPTESRPLFLIDSEGMAFRGDEFDFVTSGPAAIIAKMIVWITSDRLLPPDILADIRDYLKGLDRISTGGNGTVDKGPSYGVFVVVLNKMQTEDQTDEELFESLMNYGSSEEDDETRDQLYDRFEGISVIGLPLIHLEEGEEFGYPVLTERFRQGLNKIANNILEASESPRMVTVGNKIYQLNSTEAETVIGLVIKGANDGNIDLSDPCKNIVNINKEKVDQELSRVNEEFERSSSSKCISTPELWCSECVCAYRTRVAEMTKQKLTDLIENGKSDADQLCGSDSISQQIGDLMEKVVLPWFNQNKCTHVVETKEDPGVCDVSEMEYIFDQNAGKPISISCENLFLCESVVVSDSELDITTKNIFIASVTSLTMGNPSKGENGATGQPESEGGTGEHGKVGKNIQLIVEGDLLRGSETHLSAILNGGDGGDGGEGGPGLQVGPGQDGVKGEDGKKGDNGSKGADGQKYPTVGTSGDAANCNDVVYRGHTTSQHEHSCHHHCGEQCKCCSYNDYKNFEYTAESSCPGEAGNGGNGGRGHDGGRGQDGGTGGIGETGSVGGNGGMGGDGGEAGHLLISGSGLSFTQQRNGGKGGKGGKGGSGGPGGVGGKGGEGGKGGPGGEGGTGGLKGYGVSQSRAWTATRHWHVSAGCHGIFGFECRKSNQEDGCDSFVSITPGPYVRRCEGKDGEKGPSGSIGPDGGRGEEGETGHRGQDGEEGEFGEDAPSDTFLTKL